MNFSSRCQEWKKVVNALHNEMNSDKREASRNPAAKTWLAHKLPYRLALWKPSYDCTFR